MIKRILSGVHVLCAVGVVILTSCGGFSPRPPMISFRIDNQPVVPRSEGQMFREINARNTPMPASTRARKGGGYMRPKFITVHSTANPSGDALDHVSYLNNGKSGLLNWHFTVDQNMVVKHLPLDETGRHADRGGYGDKFSIGIEMCEKRSHNAAATYMRAAKLCAILMKQYNIPLRNVVPHYFWTRKNCPGPLLDAGRPGYKWSWFISRVDYYKRCLDAPRVAPQGATNPNAVRPVPSAPPSAPYQPQQAPVSAPRTGYSPAPSAGNNTPGVRPARGPDAMRML